MTPSRRLPSRILIPLLGDLWMLLLFAIIGRISHQTGLELTAVLITAFPFVVAWVSAGFILGLYRPEVADSPSRSVKKTALVTVVSVPFGAVIRAFFLNEGAIIVSFLIVSWIAVLAFMMPWRWGWARWIQRKNRVHPPA